MVKKIDWETITGAATPSADWSNTNIARFHYFNPKGLYAKKKAADARIEEGVDIGKYKWSAHYIYGVFNDYATKEMMKLATQKRCSRIQLAVAISMLEDDILKAEKFLATTD